MEITKRYILSTLFILLAVMAVKAQVPGTPLIWKKRNRVDLVVQVLYLPVNAENTITGQCPQINIVIEVKNIGNMPTSGPINVELSSLPPIQNLFTLSFTTSATNTTVTDAANNTQNINIDNPDWTVADYTAGYWSAFYMLNRVLLTSNTVLEPNGISRIGLTVNAHPGNYGDDLNLRASILQNSGGEDIGNIANNYIYYQRFFQRNGTNDDITCALPDISTDGLLAMPPIPALSCANNGQSWQDYFVVNIKNVGWVPTNGTAPVSIIVRNPNTTDGGMTHFFKFEFDNTVSSVTSASTGQTYTVSNTNWTVAPGPAPGSLKLTYTGPPLPSNGTLALGFKVYLDAGAPNPACNGCTNSKIQIQIQVEDGSGGEINSINNIFTVKTETDC